jgi:outer membrane protein assembly factor BamB
VEGNRVYYVSNRGELMCVDLQGFHDKKNDGPYQDEKSTGLADGDVIWKIDMVKELGVFKRDASDFGNPTSSPIIYENLVYCVTGHGRLDRDSPFNADAPSFIAVHKHTGKVVWSSNEPGGNIICSQWSSPALVRVNEQVQVVFPGGDGCLYGFEPKSGRRIWKVDCNAPRKLGECGMETDLRGFFFPKLTVRKNSIYVGIHQGEAPWSTTHFPLYAINLQRHGKPTFHWIRNDKEFSGTLGSVAVAGDIMFTVSDTGWLMALDVANGRELSRCDLLGQPSTWGSPYIHGGKLYVATVDRLFVFSSGRDYKCLGQYDFGTTIRGTPVSDGKYLYVTTNSYVWALRL